MTINFIIAQVFGAIALIVLIISLQKNNKKTLLKYQIFSSLLYAIQYVFLNAYTGCLMNLACMGRNIAFNKYQDKKPPIYLLIIVIFLMIAFSAFTYVGYISLLPMIAVILYSIAVWNGNLKVIRNIELISCSLYIIYNINVQAYTGLVATIIEFIGALIALVRFDIKGKVLKENE